MLTRNRGKFKSVVEILGLKKKIKKSSSKSRVTLKAKTSKLPKGTPRKPTYQKNDKNIKNEENMDLLNSSETINENQISAQTEISDLQSEGDSHQNAEYLNTLSKSHERFDICDCDLKEMIGEIGETGRLFRSPHNYHAAKALKDRQCNGNVPVKCNFKDEFREKLFASLFESLDKINMEVDEKDSMLVSVRLTRPGVQKSLRIRRKVRRQNAVNLCKPRLRPNPRKKKFSDASVSDGEGEVTRRRQSTRTRNDRNVSLAAKKLAMAKSRAVNERRKSETTTRPRAANNSYRRSLRKATVGRRMRVGEIYEDSLHFESSPAQESQEQAQQEEVTEEGADDQIAEKQRRRIMNPELSLLGRLLLGIQCTAVSGEKKNQILIKNLTPSDYQMLNKRIKETIFNLESLSTFRDQNTNEDKFNVVLAFSEDSQAILSEEITKSEDRIQKAPRLPKPAPASRAKSSITQSRQNKKPAVRQPHPLQILGLRHIRAKYEAVKNGQNKSDTPVTAASPAKSPNGAENTAKSSPVLLSRALSGFLRNHHRRDINRRVVRKVYTGSALVPKILDRRRAMPTTTPATSISQAQPVMAVSSQYSHDQTTTLASMPNIAENTQLPHGQTPESMAQNDVDTQPAPEAKNETEPVNKDGDKSNENHSNCADQSCSPCARAKPASSMCASQLLKLKRQQDDKQSQQPTLSSEQAVLVTSTTTTPTAVDSIARITLSKPIAPIPALQPSVQQKLTAPVQTNLVVGGPRAPAVPTLPVVSTPIVSRINPTTGTIVPHAVTFLVPAISTPISTIINPQTPMVSSTPIAHVQAIPSQGIFPTKRRIPVRSPSVAPNSAMFPLVPRFCAIERLPTSVSTPQPIAPAATSSSVPGKRQMIHKCHTLRRITPKPPVSAGVPIPSTSKTSPSTLKSLLESGSKATEEGSSTASVQRPVSAPAPTLPTTVSQPPIMSTDIRQDSAIINQTPTPHHQQHQSRGTWQVGGRAIILGVSMNKSPSNSTSPAVAASTESAPEETLSM